MAERTNNIRLNSLLFILPWDKGRQTNRLCSTPSLRHAVQFWEEPRRDATSHGDICYLDQVALKWRRAVIIQYHLVSHSNVSITQTQLKVDQLSNTVLCNTVSAASPARRGELPTHSVIRGLADWHINQKRDLLWSDMIQRIALRVRCPDHLM